MNIRAIQIYAEKRFIPIKKNAHAFARVCFPLVQICTLFKFALWSRCTLVQIWPVTYLILALKVVIHCSPATEEYLLCHTGNLALRVDVMSPAGSA